MFRAGRNLRGLPVHQGARRERVGLRQLDSGRSITPGCLLFPVTTGLQLEPSLSPLLKAPGIDASGGLQSRGLSFISDLSRMGKRHPGPSILPWLGSGGWQKHSPLPASSARGPQTHFFDTFYSCKLYICSCLHRRRFLLKEGQSRRHECQGGGGAHERAAGQPWCTGAWGAPWTELDESVKRLLRITPGVKTFSGSQSTVHGRKPGATSASPRVLIKMHSDS